MEVKRRHNLLVFEDIVGVQGGYKGLFREQLEKAGINEKNTRVTSRSSYKIFTKKQHLIWKPPRKHPGFNTAPDSKRRVFDWVNQCIQQHTPDLIVCFDPAILFIFNPDWAQATLDKLRGGLYLDLGIPAVITLPMTALHNKAKASDIAKLNQGFTEKGEFDDYKKEIELSTLTIDNDGDSEADDSDDDDDDFGTSDVDSRNEESKMEWHEPIIIPFGKIMLEYDFGKVGRLLRRIPVGTVNGYSITSKGD